MSSARNNSERIVTFTCTGTITHKTKKQRHDPHPPTPVKHTSLFSLLEEEALLTAIFRFVGCGNYRFLAPVSKSFRKAYLKEFHETNTYFGNAVLSLPCTKIAIQEKTQGEETKLACYAAKHGHIQVFKLSEPKDNNNNKRHIIDACTLAAKGGQLEMLKWARNNGYQWSSRTFKMASRNGNLDILNYLANNNCPMNGNANANGNGTTDTDDITLTAAQAGHLHVLQWARSKGYPWNTNTCSISAQLGHLQILQWATAEGCPCDQQICTQEAAKAGHLDILKWARSTNFAFHELTCNFAAGGGHLETLKWTIDNQCPCNAECLIPGAAITGHVHTAQWARNQGFPWDEDTCKYAARGGHLPFLQLARTNGCPWNYETCLDAAAGNHVEVLEWAVSHGCPYQEHLCLRHAAAALSHKTLQWIQKKRLTDARDAVLGNNTVVRNIVDFVGIGSYFESRFL